MFKRNHIENEVVMVATESQTKKIRLTVIFGTFEEAKSELRYILIVFMYT